MRSREPDALILHQHARAVVPLAHRDVYGRSGRREAKRVVEDVLDRGPQTFWICVDPYRVGFGHELQTTAVGLLDQGGDELGQVESPAIQSEASRFELPDLEHVIREALEVAALPSQLVDRAPLRGRESGCLCEIRDRCLDLTSGTSQRVRDQGERLLAMPVDASQGDALAAHLIDE